MRAILVATLSLAIPVLTHAASPAPPGELASEKVIRALTQDEDGDRRETKIWVVVVDGEPFIRTGDTRWFKNLERGSSLSLLLDDKEYPARAMKVSDAKLVETVHQTFREKYGFQDRLVGLFGGGGNVFRLESPK